MQTQQIVKRLFNNEAGQPFILTPGQIELFDAVFDPTILRVVSKAYTQYGKSDVTSMAIDLMAIRRREKVLIVAPSTDQAKIIMGNVIRHFFDNKIFESMLETEGSLEALRSERSKKRITLTNGSEIFILTANLREVSKEARNLMGFGATVVVVDESSLLSDEMFSKILRMVGGVEDGKIVQLGNPFERNHFARAFKDPYYKSITIDYKQGIKEGRITPEFIEEARREMSEFDFRIMYECKFVDSTGRVFKGYRECATAIPKKPIKDHIYVMGVDLAKVQDYTVITVYDRRNNKQVYQDRFNKIEWPFQKKKIKAVSKHYNNALIYIDATGLGDPIADDLLRAGIPVEPYKLTNQSKKEIIEKLVIWIEQRKVEIINIPETIAELANFTYDITRSGLISYNAPQGFHDDIVIAHALAVWGLAPLYPEDKSKPVSLIRSEYLKRQQGDDEYF